MVPLWPPCHPGSGWSPPVGGGRCLGHSEYSSGQWQYLGGGMTLPSEDWSGDRITANSEQYATGWTYRLNPNFHSPAKDTEQFATMEVWVEYFTFSCRGEDRHCFYWEKNSELRTVMPGHQHHLCCLAVNTSNWVDKRKVRGTICEITFLFLLKQASHQTFGRFNCPYDVGGTDTARTHWLD